VHKALADGNKRAVVVLTRPEGYRKKPMKNNWMLRLGYRKYPKLVECMKERANKYNRTLEQLELLEKEGSVFIIRPTEAITVSRLENNPHNLKNVYDSSLLQMEAVIPKLRDWLKS